MATVRKRFTAPELRALQDIRIMQESNNHEHDVYTGYTYTYLFSKEKLSRSIPSMEMYWPQINY